MFDGNNRQKASVLNKRQLTFLGHVAVILVPTVDPSSLPKWLLSLFGSLPSTLKVPHLPISHLFRKYEGQTGDGRTERVGTLNTLGRGGAKATAPGMEKGGSWGQARGGGLESRQGLGAEDALPEQVVCREEGGTKLELGRRGWGGVTGRRQGARRRRLGRRRGEALRRVPVARRTLTRVPPQGAGGLLPQLREQEVARGLQVLEGAELDDGAGHGWRDPAPSGDLVP